MYVIYLMYIMFFTMFLMTFWDYYGKCSREKFTVANGIYSTYITLRFVTATLFLIVFNNKQYSTNVLQIGSCNKVNVRGVTIRLKISKMESVATIVNSFQPITIVGKLSILDVCGGPGYASERSVIQRNFLRN